MGNRRQLRSETPFSRKACSAKRSWLSSGLVIGALLALLWGTPSQAQAKEFGLTGTLDCRVISGAKCTFTDWATGPTFGVFTWDISGSKERVVLDASLVRKDLAAFHQDDEVWFTVRDGVLPGKTADGQWLFKITSVIEHKCNGDRSEGLVNWGLSTSVHCVLENGKDPNEKKKD